MSGSLPLRGGAPLEGDDNGDSDMESSSVSINRKDMLERVGKAALAMSPTGKTEPRKVTIVGSGNWACAIAGIVAANCARQAHLDSTVRMWVFDEVVDGKKLTDWMNLEHENVKYLPGVKLPENIVAIADVGEACQDADVLIFCLPHQFLDRVCQGVKGRASPDAIAVSLIKAVEFDESGVVLISEMIKKMLGGMDVSVLMGANLAGEVAAGSFCETTVGYRVRRNGLLVRDIFDDPLFRVGMVNDVDGVEVCGALKNVVALGAGFCDGMGLGQNSKAAMVRIGLMEMKKFIQERFPGVKDETFFESCGVADLLVTCYGGRNRRCAEEFVRSGGTKSWEDIEAELLNGQKLQGTLTAKEVYKILEKEKALDEFPLFASIHQVAFAGAAPDLIIAKLSRPRE